MSDSVRKIIGGLILLVFCIALAIGSIVAYRWFWPSPPEEVDFLTGGDKYLNNRPVIAILYLGPDSGTKPPEVDWTTPENPKEKGVGGKDLKTIVTVINAKPNAFNAADKLVKKPDIKAYAVRGIMRWDTKNLYIDAYVGDASALMMKNNIKVTNLDETPQFDKVSFLQIRIFNQSDGDPDSERGSRKVIADLFNDGSATYLHVAKGVDKDAKKTVDNVYASAGIGGFTGSITNKDNKDANTTFQATIPWDLLCRPNGKFRVLWQVKWYDSELDSTGTLIEVHDPKNEPKSEASRNTTLASWDDPKTWGLAIMKAK